MIGWSEFIYHYHHHDNADEVLIVLIADSYDSADQFPWC